MELKVKKSWLLETSLIFSILILVFLYDFFSSKIGFFDELIALFSFLVIIYQVFLHQKTRLFNREYLVIFFLLLLVFIGLLSNAYSCIIGFCTDLPAIIADAITFSKAFVVYFAIRFLNNSIDSNQVLNKLAIYSERIFYILVLFVVLDIIFKIYPRENRFGIQSIELFFQHTSRYAFAFSFIFLVLLPKYYQKKLGLLFLVLFFGLLSLRIKYIGFLLLTTIFIFYGKRLVKIPKTFVLYFLIFVVLILSWVFKERIQMYFVFDGLNEAWSRAVILYYSFIIGFDFFPLGTGFGTYSSYYSGAYYSWVYDMYEISHVYGIKRTHWKFIADQYWPMVLGQFGYLGLVSMLIIVYNYFMLFLTKVKSNLFNNSQYYLYLGALLGLLMLLIDSTSDSIFSQQRAVVMFAYFALIINISSNRESTSN